jgi:hypothetical protein
MPEHSKTIVRHIGVILIALFLSQSNAEFKAPGSQYGKERKYASSCQPVIPETTSWPAGAAPIPR